MCRWKVSRLTRTPNREIKFNWIEPYDQESIFEGLIINIVMFRPTAYFFPKHRRSQRMKSLKSIYPFELEAKTKKSSLTLACSKFSSSAAVKIFMSKLTGFGFGCALDYCRLSRIVCNAWTIGTVLTLLYKDVDRNDVREWLIERVLVSSQIDLQMSTFTFTFISIELEPVSESRSMKYSNSYCLVKIYANFANLATRSTANSLRRHLVTQSSFETRRRQISKSDGINIYQT